MKPGSGQPAKPGPTVDILVNCPLWRNERGLRTVLRHAIAEAGLATRSQGDLAIVLSDDETVRALNRDWRRKDQPTNVLSFPAVRRSGGLSAKGHGASKHGNRTPRAVVPDSHRCLGDIVIAYETAAREAKAEHKALRHHVAHLAVHGFLHLVGYDHHADKGAAIMESLEIAVLASIGIPNPYVARVPNG
jgi:probable rRNA maturation factor